MAAGSLAPERSAVDEPRFVDTLRGLPRAVWIVSLGSLILTLGSFLPAYIVLYLVQQGRSAGTAGLVLGAYGVGKVVGNAVGGWLTDKVDRRWTILLSAVVTAGLTAAVPYVGPVPGIVAVVGLVGVTSQVYRPAAAAVLIGSVTTDRQRLAAFGTFRFAMNVGVAVGGVLGGVLAHRSYAALFLVNAATILLFGLAVAGLLRDPPPPGSAGDAAADRAAGYRAALADRTLLRFLVMTVCAEFVYIQYAVGLPLHIGAVGLDERAFGLLIGLNGVLVLTLELPVLGAVARFRPERVLAAGVLLGGVGLALTGLTTGLATLAATVVLWTFGEMLYASVAQAHLASLSPPGLVGRYQGLYGVAYTTGTGLGPLVGGAVYALGPWALWVLVGGLGLLATHLSLRLRRPAPVPTAPDGGDTQ